MPPKTDAFRANVRRFAKLRGLSLTDLADRAGLSREWLSKMVNGRSNPTLPVCERIAAALGLSLEALISEAVPTNPEKIDDSLLTVRSS